MRCLNNRYLGRGFFSSAAWLMDIVFFWPLVVLARCTLSGKVFVCGAHFRQRRSLRRALTTTMVAPMWTWDPDKLHAAVLPVALKNCLPEMRFIYSRCLPHTIYIPFRLPPSPPSGPPLTCWIVDGFWQFKTDILSLWKNIWGNEVPFRCNKNGASLWHTFGSKL